MKRIPSILVVEDDPNLANLIAELLEEGGYAAQAASTGARALAHMEVEPLDLVILDWMLPDTQGDELCRAIKARFGHTFLPILMLTARSTLADRIAGFEAGADDYLTKPFHADELLARVRALLRIRTAEVERSEALVALARQHQELKEAYHQLRATQAQLVQASKLAALGELVAGVAHELNNPLAIILGNAELLPEPSDDEDQRAIAQIIAAAHRARRVVQSLVTFARHGKLEADWYHPRDLVERVLDLRRASLQTGGIALHVEYAPELPMLLVDSSQIQQALLNLLLNAEQALEGRPDPRIEIRVFLSAAPPGPPPILPARDTPPPPENGQLMVVFDIADNGPGLPEQIADQIFQPFVTTRPVGEGTGLGLAISYGIVAQHGGSLQVSSEPGRGATFRIALKAERRTESASSSPLAPPGDHHSVLVVDDEQDILDLVQRFLARQGYSVTGVPSARSALQMLQDQSCDVVLCDIRMPDMDGMAFYEQLQSIELERRPHLIFMTGDTSRPQTEEFLRRSGLPVLRKPFGGRELLERLTALQS